MKNILKPYHWIFLLTLLSATACSENDPAPDPGPVVEPLISLPAQWYKATELMEGFPEGIEVYRNTTAYNGKAMNAYCVVFDPTNPNLEFKPVLAGTNTKPSELYEAEPGVKYACINGGFFGTGISYSLVQQNNAVMALNIRALTRPYNGVSTTYYPTRGAFGLTEQGSPEVTWMYHIGSGTGTMYSYPAPSPNALDTEPQPKPTATFPQGGEVWNVSNAIGGSPVLIKNNEINITDTKELIAVDNASSRARSAIGHTADGKVIMLAIEGNNPEGGEGLSLPEVASLMKEMGCTGALNLDGGGSTYMMVNGMPTVQPSSSTGERAVMSVVFVKKK